jgi:hypothetical protein
MSDQDVVGLATAVNLAGRITAGGRTRMAIAHAAVLLAGGISAKSAARIAIPRVSAILTGRITAKSTTQIAVALVPPHPLSLAGTVSGRASARVQMLPWVLSGTIHAQGTIRGRTPPYLSGTIHAQGTIRGTFPPYLVGRITAQGQIRGATPPYLSGRITARSTALTQQAVFTHPLVYGRITASSRVNLNQSFFTTRLYGTVTAASHGSLAARLLPLAGSITARSRAQLYQQPNFALNLFGSIAASSRCLPGTS